MKRLALVLACLLAAGAARADDVTAAEWKRRGDDAMDAGRAAEALGAYRHAMSLEPSPALEYNVARALLAVGDFASALDAFETFERDAPEDLKQKTRRVPEVIDELRAKVATVEIVGTPRGARVFVRELPAGTAPVTLRANPGRAAVRVELEDHDTFTKTVDLRAGETTRVVAVLAPTPTTGRLVIAARPIGAYVTIDGRSAGAAPIALTLTQGSHELRVEAPSHRPRLLTVEVARGGDRRVDLELEKEGKPLTAKWWFWGAIGLAAATTAAILIVTTTERDPHDGSLGTFTVP